MTQKNVKSQIAANVMKTNRNRYEDKQGMAPLSFEMLLGQFKICVLSEKIWKFIDFSDHSLAFQSIFWKV